MTRLPAFGLALVVIAGSASLAFAWVGDLGLAMIAMSVAGLPAFLIGSAAMTGVARSSGTARHRKSLHAEPPRPDADVAQYLNDDDRKWLGGHGWTAPADEVAIEPKRSSWQTDLDRRIRAQLPISSHPRMAAGGVQVAVTPRSTSVREDIRCVQQKLQALERRDPSDDWQSYLGEAFINPSLDTAIERVQLLYPGPCLIAEHKIEDDESTGR